METMRVEGPTAVASLLRQMADGIEAGVISLGDARIGCSPDMAAVVNAPDPGPDRLLLVSLRFELPTPRAHHLAVEEELLRPGD